MTTLHLCIATGQNAANFIPLKQLQAQEVWILETPAMKKSSSGTNLKLALKPYVPLVKCLDFDDGTPQLVEQAAARLAENSLDGRDVVFHITGGTKLMMLAIHQELSLLNTGSGRYRTLYADTQKQTLVWMEKPLSQEPMQDVLTLQDALLLNGYRTTNDTRPAKDQQRAAARSKVSRFMGDNAGQLLSFFSVLAKAATFTSETNQFAGRLDSMPWGRGAELLELAVQLGLIQWTKGSYSIEFNGNDATSFFRGGWLEEFVFLKIQGLQLKPDHYAMNVKVEQVNTATANEIDAIVVKNNRVLFLECKAGKQVGTVQDAIYKLSQVKNQIGGALTQGLYISAKPLTELGIGRAKEYRINVLAGNDLSQLSQYLRDWAKA